ncbi:putative RNA polymerase II subunit B1 CTD phosphatase rpap2 [Scleropages formosus]|uniref:putative RNA polymerase II subunit B1 CTD phosphatase rpap2 n=1 Tax=Scleropages formosus TaxID=113540 RepID=UPI000878F4E4|nr:putative RNA polymerase II subunit B1 CTD phosphatase RPAP2 [Scleropages formosus]
MAEEQRVRSRSRKPGKKGGNAIKPQNAQDVAKRREALKETLKLKLELEKKARSVVGRLLEDGVTGDFLIDCARLITPSNYKDAVEERSIVKMCGYPVCSNQLCNVPKQQYKISTKTNKVYDITERKCFCSNFCYRASKYFEVQISKTPLWLRAEERPPDVKLLKEGQSGSSGVEVKIADLPIREAEIENPAPEKAADPALPLVDSRAQHSIQKRIVVEKIDRSLRDIVGQLRLTMSEISTDLNNLVRTFRFTNTNIIHKSPEWTLIAVVLLFVLSEVSVLLRESLARPSSVVYISTLMKELGLKDEDLQDLVQIFKS